MSSSQIYARTSSSINIFKGYPDFDELNLSEKFNQTDANFRINSSIVSPCGRFLAIASNSNVQVFSGESFNELKLTLQLNNVYDLHFSPSGNYLSTWERPPVDQPEYPNVKIFYINNNDANSTNEIQFEYQSKSQNGWYLQFSKLDDYVIKMNGSKQLRIVKLTPGVPFNFNKPWTSLTTSGQQPISTFLISPATEHPTICIFQAEKGGKPAVLSIYPIVENKIETPIVSKNFFKADSCQLTWNNAGTAILCLAITDFDQSNKSYYGENTLYLITFQGVNGKLGGQSMRVSLNEEGPIHGFTWSPTNREFAVCYGFMPATTTFFDLRANVIHSIPKLPRNTIDYSPSGRHIILAGFGNLQGSVDILDRYDKYKKVSTFNAANSVVCKWSPGGEFILTATTSPRLRVDNGLKIWHYTGKLVFIREYKELLKIDWRISENPTDPKVNSLKDLIIHPSAEKYILDHPSSVSNPSALHGSNGSGSTGSGGAYRPPHARRAAAAAANGVKINNAKVQRNVVGLVPGATPLVDNNATKKKKKHHKKKDDGSNSDGNTSNNNNTIPKVNTDISPEQKKIRSLLKKLRAIETLKEKKANGDKLEDTQVLKIQTEDKVLKELNFLGWTRDDI
ncbi:related to Eukaryotic translation initiation factor 2A [Saccharomycodes ludwigii]|uniref:Eukaryotic translation initiation factor 2A n=1 Tax=Saccharomycodes ludwigii TaxID=36035 RepID=A0A376BB65_9ASCO|nr:hypothetical protein SCDLUD_000825 [Saccharomycodes ludwigii]KAH3903206.1 hypothetical protein SCDLUD_000825 [Saccharomycodes ludwigii]SSD61923.1 related to Eukaryotic translation initiation factor 2A [Saccharomycodes ludwigii]